MTIASNEGSAAVLRIWGMWWTTSRRGPFQALPIGARAPYLVGQRAYGGGERAWWLERSSQPSGARLRLSRCDSSTLPPTPCRSNPSRTVGKSPVAMGKAQAAETSEIAASCCRWRNGEPSHIR